MASLYALGFRQGMVLDLPLTVPVAVFQEGVLSWSTVAGEQWLIATQDCDLDLQDEHQPVELRQVMAADGDEPQGIRSRFFVLPNDRKLDSKGLRPLLPGSWLAIQDLGQALPDTRLLALKLWLGRRYDRPAVPPEFVPLMQRLAKALVKNAGRKRLHAQTRDVFVDIDATHVPPHYALTAVCGAEAELEAVQLALAEAALEVPLAMGTLVDVSAVTTDEAAISLLENAFVADLSDSSIRAHEVLGDPPL